MAPKDTKKAAPKKAELIFEMNGQQLSLKDIESAVKTVKGAKTAYINTAEAAAYCVDANGQTVKVSLTDK